MSVASEIERSMRTKRLARWSERCIYFAVISVGVYGYAVGTERQWLQILSIALVLVLAATTWCILRELTPVAWLRWVRAGHPVRYWEVMVEGAEAPVFSVSRYGAENVRGQLSLAGFNVLEIKDPE